MYIIWDNFTDINILEKGVCEGKICCISVTYKNNKYVLKEVSKKMNYGKDYLIMDKCKKYFGLNDMNMKIIKSNKGLVKINTELNRYANNCKIDTKECVYCMMNYWENIGDMRTYIDIVDDSVIYQCIKIILFNGLFLSSDNSIRNILINKEYQLLSIDEDDILGKTKKVFLKSPWCKKEKFRKMLYDIIQKFIDNKELIKRNVNNIFIKNNLEICDLFNNRLDNYKQIIENEL